MKNMGIYDYIHCINKHNYIITEIYQFLMNTICLVSVVDNIKFYFLTMTSKTNSILTKIYIL